ncbi:hypothetical protein ACWCQW_43320 [Streptomyces mirabilis]
MGKGEIGKRAVAAVTAEAPVPGGLTVQGVEQQVASIGAVFCSARRMITAPSTAEMTKAAIG